jgi:hypothetical protein
MECGMQMLSRMLANQNYPYNQSPFVISYAVYYIDFDCTYFVEMSNFFQNL